MFFSNRIRLFWWNEKKIQGKSKENYGDLLGKYLVEKISKKKAVWSKPSQFCISNIWSHIYVTIGSILPHVNKNCIVWGSGIISKQDAIKNAEFLAVRGPQTRKFLLQKGYNVPEVYGDPALLLPKYYNSKVKKTYKIGLVPHYSDYKMLELFYKEDPDILLISLMTNDIEKTTDNFLKCERVVSSSLHGIIVSHAYGIPSVWQKFSNNVFGDDIKYQDYFESVSITPYTPEIIDKKMVLKDFLHLFEDKQTLPKEGVIEQLCSTLMEVCPFKS